MIRPRPATRRSNCLWDSPGRRVPAAIGAQLRPFVDDDDLAAPDANCRRKQLQTVADDFAVGRARGGAYFEADEVRLDAQARTGEHGRYASGKAIGEQDRSAQYLSASPHCRR